MSLSCACGWCTIGSMLRFGDNLLVIKLNRDWWMAEFCVGRSNGWFLKTLPEVKNEAKSYASWWSSSLVCWWPWSWRKEFSLSSIYWVCSIGHTRVRDMSSVWRHGLWSHSSRESKSGKCSASIPLVFLRLLFHFIFLDDFSVSRYDLRRNQVGKKDGSNWF